LGKIIFEIAEDNFSKKSSAHYELSILNGMDSFVYMITDSGQSLLLLREYQLEQAPKYRLREQQQLIQQDELLRRKYLSIRAGVITPYQTTIPNRLFNTQAKETYLSHLTDLGEDYELRVDPLPGFAAQNVYALPQSLIHSLRQAFPGARFFHHSTAFLRVLKSFAGHLSGRNLFLHIWEHKLQIVLFEEKELLLINYFDYQTAKDFIYYVLLTFEQFSLKPERQNVYVSGKILTDSEIYRQLERYLKNIHFLQPPAFLRLGSQLQQRPKYFYFDLFCLLSCS